MPASSTVFAIEFAAISLLHERCKGTASEVHLSKACAKQQGQALPALDRHMAAATDPATLAFNSTEFDKGLGRKAEGFGTGPRDAGIQRGNIRRNLPNLDPVAFERPRPIHHVGQDRDAI